MKHFRQGNSLPILINFDESLEDKTMIAAVYDAYGNKVWKGELGIDILSLGNNVYRMEIPHSVTKKFVGKYFLDIMIKSPNDTSYVNVCDKPVEMVFKEAKIIREIETVEE